MRYLHVNRNELDLKCLEFEYEVMFEPLNCLRWIRG